MLRNRYFPQTTRSAMWSGGTSGGQANGWTINTKVTQVDKTGSNQGSDARIRIDVVNGITVVALTNIDDPSADTTALTQQLLDIAQANP